MNTPSSFAIITLLHLCMSLLLFGGCATQRRSGTEEPSRRFGGAEEGERVTSAELEGLTRAFADRYVGLMYSVCEALKQDNADPSQRRAAQMLLTDTASNVYDIASNADAFTRVLDLVVVMTLVSQEWDDDGKALEVFGERGQKLADALSKARAESRVLAARVLTADQLATLDSLLLDWRQENPKVVRASFIRFSDFATGRGRSAATQLLATGGLFAAVGEAGQAVDEARLLGERIFYLLKRESTLLRWHAVAIKDDLIATPELNTALADVQSLTDEIERLPANIAAERQAILTAVDDALLRADATITNVRAALDQATTFAKSLRPAGESINELLMTADTLFARHEASDQLKTGDGGRPFDIREYGQTAEEVTLAAGKMSELLSATEHLLGSPDLRERIKEVHSVVDGTITTLADESQVVIDALFWRACALLGVLFVMLIMYQVVSFLLIRNRGNRQAAG